MRRWNENVAVIVEKFPVRGKEQHAVFKQRSSLMSLLGLKLRLTLYHLCKNHGQEFHAADQAKGCKTVCRIHDYFLGHI